MGLVGGHSSPLRTLDSGSLDVGEKPRTRDLCRDRTKRTHATGDGRGMVSWRIKTVLNVAHRIVLEPVESA